MTVKELASQDKYEIINLGDPDAQIESVYCCDLLSIAMGNAPAGGAWCTVMNNMNTLAVASLTETACVILCCGAKADDNVKLKSVSQGINVLVTKEPIFETALDIHTQIGK